MSAGLEVFGASGRMVFSTRPAFIFTYDGWTYGFDAPAEDHERARELVGEGEVTEAAFVELNLMFDMKKSGTCASFTMTDPAGVVRARFGVW